MRVDVHQELACDRHGGLVEVREQSRMLGKTKRVQIQIACPIKSIRGSIFNIEYSQSTGCLHRHAQLKGRSKKR